MRLYLVCEGDYCGATYKDDEVEAARDHWISSHADMRIDPTFTILTESDVF